MRQNKKPALRAIDVLPDSALCVISSNNFPELANKLTNQNLVWQEAVNVKEFSDINVQLRFFDSVITENESMKSFFQSRILHFALYREKAANTFLIVFNLNEIAQEEEFLEEAEKVLKANPDKEGNLNFQCANANYNLVCKRGVVLISNNLYYSERAFNEARKKQNAKKDFEGLKKLLNKENICNVYTNHHLIASESGIQEGKALFTGASVFDVEFDPADITFNGFNSPDSSSVLNALAGQKAQPCDFFNYLPFDMVSYTAFAFSDHAQWKAQVQADGEKVPAYWKFINDSALFNVRKQLEDNIGNKVLEVELKYTNTISKALLVEIRDSSEVNEVLHYVSDTTFIEQGIRAGKLKPNA